jgi:hypothetical protein
MIVLETPAAIRSKLIGAWQLVSYHVCTPSGETHYPYGEKPVGLLLYTDTGYMSAQIMKPERARQHRPGTESADELKSSFNGYIAYFGTYTVSDDSKIVTHHVEGSLHTWILQTAQERFINLNGTKLVLSTELQIGLKTRRHEITWERVK